MLMRKVYTLLRYARRPGHPLQRMQGAGHGRRSHNRKCSCGKCRPSFGMPGGRATHCKECKEQGMVDVSHRKCSCGKSRPYFGMPGGSATHCKECKDEGMVDIRSMSRIINAHGVFWLGLMENFAEHQEPFGPKTQKCKVRHS